MKFQETPPRIDCQEKKTWLLESATETDTYFDIWSVSETNKQSFISDLRVSDQISFTGTKVPLLAKLVIRFISSPEKVATQELLHAKYIQIALYLDVFTTSCCLFFVANGEVCEPLVFTTSCLKPRIDCSSTCTPWDHHPQQDVLYEPLGPLTSCTSRTGKTKKRWTFNHVTSSVNEHS